MPDEATLAVGRERDHRHAARAGDLLGARHRMREQRPEEDLGAFIDRLRRRLLSAGRGAAVVLDHELDVGAAELGERHLGGIAHRLAGDAGIAASRERQDYADLHPAGGTDGTGGAAGGVAERRRGDRGRRRRRRRRTFDDRRPAAEQIGPAATTGERARKRAAPPPASKPPASKTRGRVEPHRPGG